QTSNMSKKGKTRRGTEVSVFLQQLEQSETAFSFFFSFSSKQIMDFADFKLYRKLSNPDLALCLKYTLDIAKLTRQYTISQYLKNKKLMIRVIHLKDKVTTNFSLIEK
ncbi:hypothetical protein PanWU01x14_152510, partial [Parasponia andersonii]